MKVLLGIDPGTHTGLAIFQDGRLVELKTIHPIAIYPALAMWKPYSPRVVFEDSRLTSPVWSRGTTVPARLKIARNVGHVDAYCGLIVEACAQLGIPAHGISPKGKGAKLNAEQFRAATGWAGASNEHTRDACMVAYPYRLAEAKKAKPTAQTAGL